MENAAVRLMCLIFSFIVLVVQLQCGAVTVAKDFFLYGTNVGDSIIERVDDATAEVSIPSDISYPFFGRNSPSVVHFAVNGIITFNDLLLYYNASFTFPAIFNQTIAVFWGDADTRQSGRLYYRISSDGGSLEKATKLVRRVFLSQWKFEAQSVMVATWIDVGYFNQKADKLNTYQCVVASDSKRVFIILLYADIQWVNTDGTDYALVGFNAGDKVHSYTLPGSGRPSVKDLTLNSNVAIPGLWIYQVSGNEVVSGGCVDPTEDSTVSVTLEPSYGIELGGTLVSVQGYCFSFQQNVQCDFDGTRVTALYESELIVHCVVPRLHHRGSVPFKLFVDDVMRGEAVYTALSIESTHQVDLTPILSSSSPVLLSTSQSITLAWNPAHIIPMVDVIINPFSLDILLYTMDVDRGFWQVRAILASNIHNDGSQTVTLPADILSDDIQPLAIYISTSLSADPHFDSDHLLQRLFTSRNRIGVWTAQYYYVNPDLANQKGRDKCVDWYEIEPVSDPGVPCPATVDRARWLNSGLMEINFTSISGNSLYGTQWLKTFHQGALSCFKQVLVVDLSATLPPMQQECCYQGEGNLITGAPNGGAINKVAEDFNTLQHFQEDRRPYILCCTTTYPNCGHYYEKRPSSQGLGFNPPLPAWLIGDPHFITLDSLRYTFNGHGEFTLIETPDDSFTLQGRMVPLPNTRASIFSAIVAKVGPTGDRIQIVASKAGPNQGGLDVYINGMVASSEFLPENLFDGFLLRTKRTKTTVIITIYFSNGVYLECTTSVSEALMTRVIIRVPNSFKDQVKGLLGVFNDDQSDDLTPADNSAPLSVNSNMSTIHSKFGLSWLVTDPANSLFSYFPYENFDMYKDDSFQPIFQVFPNDAINLQCLRDVFCVYDSMVTGSNRFSKDTLDSVLQVEKLERLSNLISCNPPCKNGVCLPNDKCACSQGFTDPHCETSIVQDCLGVGPCRGTETCELHAESYTCLCPSDVSGDLCRVTTATAVSIQGSGLLDNKLIFIVMGIFIVCVLLFVFVLVSMVVICRKGLVHRNQSQNKGLIRCSPSNMNTLDKSSSQRSITQPSSYSGLNHLQPHHLNGKYNQPGLAAPNMEEEDGYERVAVDSNYLNIPSGHSVPVSANLDMNQTQQQQQYQELQELQHQELQELQYQQLQELQYYQLQELQHQQLQQSLSQNATCEFDNNAKIESGGMARYSSSSIIKPDAGDVSLKDNGCRSFVSRNSFPDRFSQAWYHLSTPSVISAGGMKGDVASLQPSPAPISYSAIPVGTISITGLPSNTIHGAHSKSYATFPNQPSQSNFHPNQHLPQSSSTSVSMHCNLSRGGNHRHLRRSRSNPSGVNKFQRRSRPNPSGGHRPLKRSHSNPSGSHRSQRRNRLNSESGGARSAVLEMNPNSAHSSVLDMNPNSARSSVLKMNHISARSSVLKMNPISARSSVLKMNSISARSSVLKMNPNSARSTLQKMNPNSASSPVLEMNPNSARSSVLEMNPNSARSSVLEMNFNSGRSSVLEMNPNSACSSVLEINFNSARSSVLEMNPNSAHSSVLEMTPDYARPLVLGMNTSLQATDV